ncbi:MAG: HlyD family efflux transporter periplasmic adaptor subunit [Candidatus Latescibacterota bacterium]
MVRRLVLLGSVLLATVVGYAAVRPLPYRLQGPGLVLPCREWVLTCGPEGQFAATLHDHAKGTVEASRVATFARGDRVAFQRAAPLRAGAPVVAGDTVGRLWSSELELQQITLQGELAAELAALARDQAGDRPAQIRLAELGVRRAEEEQAQQHRRVERMQRLLGRNAVSATDLEEAVNLLALHEVEMERAAAALGLARSPERSGELDWRRARIQALERQLETLGRWVAETQLVTPLSGRVAGAPSGDTLAVVQDTSAYLVLIPVRWEERGSLALGQRVEVAVGPGQGPAVARIASVGRTAHMASGRAYLAVRALVEEGGEALLPGLVVRCSLCASPLVGWEYLRRSLVL